MTGVGFNPFRVDEAERAQAGEQWVDGAFDDDQVRAGFEVAKDFEAVEGAGPEGRQNGKLQRAFAELDLPFFGGVGNRGGGWPDSQHDTM